MITNQQNVPILNIGICHKNEKRTYIKYIDHVYFLRKCGDIILYNLHSLSQRGLIGAIPTMKQYQTYSET